MAEFDPATGQFLDNYRSRLPDFFMTIPGIATLVGADLSVSALSSRAFKNRMAERLVIRGGLRLDPAGRLMNAVGHSRGAAALQINRIEGRKAIRGLAVQQEVGIGKYLRQKGVGRIGVHRTMLSRGLSTISRGLNFAMIVDLGATLFKTVGDMVGSYTPEKKLWRRRQLETGVPYLDTRVSQTQRQRAMQAIHNSQMTTRAILGNEASFAHRLGSY